MNQPLFDRIAIIGLGLIGSSIARCVRDRGICKWLSGAEADPNARAVAEGLDLCDAYFDDVGSAVVDADLVIVCVQIKSMGDIAKAMAPSLKPGAIVSDVGSVKSAVFAEMQAHLPAGVHFIPGHPVAGTEQSGPSAGFATLFDKRWTILTPAPDSDQDAVERLKSFWEACGSSVEIMDADHHDRVLAITSHLPHLIAYSIVGTASDLEQVSEGEVLKFSAGGFRDFTRIAASNPSMWRDVFLTNKEAVLEMLGRFSEDLSVLQRAIRWGNGDDLYDRFEKTRAIRRGIIDVGQETEEPNFGRSK
ncbi:MAG: prephenate/arogenate dehydrogenase family protein [Pseudomonadota bacterium]